MKKIILFAYLAVVFSACATRQKIMDASVVSMTHTSLPEGAKLADKGPVTGTFCSDALNDKGSLGLFDEAVKNAQSQGNVDFIANASFWVDAKGCVSVEGTGQGIEGSGRNVLK